MNGRCKESPTYISPNEKIIFDLVEKKINMLKGKGINPIRTKSVHLDQELVKENPSAPFVSWSEIYRRQIISRSCTKLGFTTTAKHYRPLLELYW